MNAISAPQMRDALRHESTRANGKRLMSDTETDAGIARRTRAGQPPAMQDEADKTGAALFGVLEVMAATGGRGAHVEDLANVLSIHDRYVRAALLALVEIEWVGHDVLTDTFYQMGDFWTLSNRMRDHFVQTVNTINPRLFALMRLGAEAVK